MGLKQQQFGAERGIEIHTDCQIIHTNRNKLEIKKVMTGKMLILV